MKYGTEKEENLYYVEIAEFLRGLGLNIPEVLAHLPDQHVAWMEDLGPEDLHGLRDAPWPVRRRAYVATLEQVHRLHRWGLSALQNSSRPVRLMGGFDSALYAWERGYFLEQFVRGACGIELRADEQRSLESELGLLAEALLAQPPVLVHRDLQSKNVMLRDGRAYLIDFQGLRRGVASYDLGSLLFDPYVAFTDEQREELLGAYWGMEEHRGPELPEARRSFFQGSVQRLMQALGAYGFLGLRQGKRSFLRHIPDGFAHLSRAAEEVPELTRLRELLDKIRREAPAELGLAAAS